MSCVHADSVTGVTDGEGVAEALIGRSYNRIAKDLEVLLFRQTFTPITIVINTTSPTSRNP